MCINLHKSKDLPKYIKISIIPLNKCSTSSLKELTIMLKKL